MSANIGIGDRMDSTQQELGVADRIPDTCRLAYDRPAADLLVFRLSGAWRIGAVLPSPDAVRQALANSPAIRRLAFDTQGVTTWDSRLVAFAAQIIAEGAARQLGVDRRGLPAGIQQLLVLAAAVPARKDTGPRARHHRSWSASV